MVAADIYRPAAIDQLRTLGEKIGVEVFSMGTDADPIGREGGREGRQSLSIYVCDTYLRSTASSLPLLQSSPARV